MKPILSYGAAGTALTAVMVYKAFQTHQEAVDAKLSGNLVVEKDLKEARDTYVMVGLFGLSVAIFGSWKRET